MSGQETVSATRSRRYPPKVTGWPYVGSLPQLWRRTLDFLLEMQQKHGDIYTLDFGNTPVTVLCHPAQAQYVLQTHASNYQEKGGSKGFRVAPYPIMAKGLAMVTSDNGAWRQQRQVMQPYFNHKHLHEITDLMIDAIEESLNDWQIATESNQPIDIEPELTRIAMNVIGRTMFGVQITPNEADAISEAIHCVIDYTWQGTLETMLPDWVSSILPGHQRYDDAIEQVHTLIDQLVMRALQTPEQDHLIGQLWQTINQQFDVESAKAYLHNEALTILLAGFESTSANLTWAFYRLVQNPDKLTLLRSEIDSVLGRRKPIFADIPELTYTRMVVQESLRLYPPSYWAQRVAAEDDEIDGYFIPAGTIVTPIFYLIHRNLDLWEDPEHFEPERFLPEQVQQRHKMAWMPFGAGQRMCLAGEFALIKEQLVLAQILQQYDVKAIPAQASNQMIVGSTLRPKASGWITASRRAVRE